MYYIYSPFNEIIFQDELEENVFSSQLNMEETFSQSSLVKVTFIFKGSVHLIVIQPPHLDRVDFKVSQRLDFWFTALF